MFWGGCREEKGIIFRNTKISDNPSVFLGLFSVICLHRIPLSYASIVCVRLSLSSNQYNRTAALSHLVWLADHAGLPHRLKKKSRDFRCAKRVKPTNDKGKLEKRSKRKIAFGAENIRKGGVCSASVRVSVLWEICFKICCRTCYETSSKLAACFCANDDGNTIRVALSNCNTKLQRQFVRKACFWAAAAATL